MTELELSLVVPCHDEADRIDELIARLRAAADATVDPGRWELLIVDDSSTDDTAARVSAHADADARIALLRPPVGRGKGAAVRAGLLAARGRLTFVTDADLAGAPEQLGDAIAALGPHAAALVGSRVLRGAIVVPPRPWRRRVPAAMFRGGARRVLAVAATDPQCGFKLFRTETVRPAATQLFTDGFAYELELLRRIADGGGEIIDHPIRWSEGGHSSIRVIADGTAMALDVLRIHRRLRRERRAGQRGAEPSGAWRPAARAPEHGDPTTRPALSVVMPLYNEVAVIDDVLDELTERVLDLPGIGAVEVIVVDDRGTDGAAERVRERAARDPRIVVLPNDANIGHGPSILRGLDRANGEWLLQLDSDGQVDLAGFAALWAGRSAADLWYGERIDRDDPLVRLVLTRAVNALVSALAGQRITDSNAGYKLLSAPLYRHLRAGVPDGTFAPSLLMVLGALRSRARVRAFGVVHRPRRSGPSSLNLRRLARAVATATHQTLTYARQPTPRFAAAAEVTVPVLPGAVAAPTRPPR